MNCEIKVLSLRKNSFDLEDILYEVALVISAENNLEQNFIIHVKPLQNKFADDIENDDKDQKNFTLEIFYMKLPLS